MSNSKTNIKQWYSKNYKDDDYKDYIKDDITFEDLWKALKSGKEIYAFIFVEDHADSIVRERLFQELSDIYEVDYDNVFNMWIGGSADSEADDIAAAINAKKENKHVIKKAALKEANRFGLKVRPLTEGAGAAYDVLATRYDVSEIKSLGEVSTVDVPDYDSVLVTCDNCDIVATADVTGESYYASGEVNAEVQITKIAIELYKSVYDEYGKDSLNALVKEAIESTSTKSKQGGGWFHVSFVGVLAATEQDIADSQGVVSMNAKMTNEEQIQFLDGAIDDGNSYVEYVVYKDGESLDAFDNQENALEFAKEQNADEVSSTEYCQTVFGGDVEAVGDSEIIWRKENSVEEN